MALEEGEFNDLTDFNQELMNSKDPEENENLGVAANTQANYKFGNDELNRDTGKDEVNIPFSLIKEPKRVNDSLCGKKRNRDEKSPSNETEKTTHPKIDIKNAPTIKKDQPNEKTEIDLVQKCVPRRKPHIKKRLVYHKKNLPKKRKKNN